MADDIDRANEQMEMSLELSLKRRAKTLQPVGFCFYCESRLNGGLFCNSDCARDYEREAYLKKIAGKK